MGVPGTITFKNTSRVLILLQKGTMSQMVLLFTLSRALAFDELLETLFVIKLDFKNMFHPPPPYILWIDATREVAITTS